jgi:hypothetical protein
MMIHSPVRSGVVFLSVALLLSLFTPSRSARATTLMRMSIAQVSRTAPVIVRARCVGNSVGWDAGEIWTFTSFDVEEVWRGPAPARVVVRLLGGRLGNITSSVSGVPRFRTDEEVVLFLEPTPRGDFSVVSWQQGTFRIRPGARTGEESVVQDTASFATFDPDTHRFQVTGVQGLSLESFRARVDAALREEPGRTQ